MCSSEYSPDRSEKLPLPTLLTVLALGACHRDESDKIAQIQKEKEVAQKLLTQEVQEGLMVVVPMVYQLLLVPVLRMM